MKPTALSPSLPTSRPAWREPMLWLVIGGPAAVVVAALATAVIAWQGADRVVDEPATAHGSAEPAQRARNHAASPR